MKSFFVAMMMFVSINAFAGVPKATLFKDLAEKTVSAMYGRQGDQVSSDLVDMDHGAVSVETWKVSLTNGANQGSALYEITITDKGTAEEDQEVASISIKFLSSN